MADEARLSAVPNRAKTFRRSFVSFPQEDLEEGSSPAMVSHTLNLFIHVCCKFRTSMDDLENKSWFWFCMEAGKEHCSMAFPASFLGKSVYCGRWSTRQVFPLYKCFQNTENKSQPGILKFETFIDQISLHLELSLKSFATFRHIRIEWVPMRILRHERGISRRPELRVLQLTVSTRTFLLLYWTIASQSKWPP